MEYYFKHSGLSFDLDPADKDKYLVIACAKNEGDYIVEWVEHYLNLGFDKVIIADNNDVGDESLPTILKPYLENGGVQIFDCRGVNYLQVGLYADFCECSNFKWCAFYDCDEFLDIGVYPNIQEYLAQFNEKYDIILLHWLMFGPNGQLMKTEGGVQERFSRPQSPVLYFKENSFVKSLVRGNAEKFEDCFFNGSHIPIPAEGKLFNFAIGGYYEPSISSHAYFQPRYKNGYIKHYYTKSFEEWANKAGRGWPDGTENLALSKYMIFRDDRMIPFSFMDKAIFKVDTSSTYEQFKQELEDYDVVSIRTEGPFTYPLFTEMMTVFQKVTDHTFVFSDNEIDDALFTILLEYGYATGNRVLFCPPERVWDAYVKFHKRNNTFYIIKFG